MPVLTVGGLDVFFHDEGTGTPVILLHCSSASHKEWLPLMAKLRGGHRILAPDLTGYGRSARWPKGRPFDGSEDFEIVAQLAKLVSEPVHLVGHSYGAAVAIGAARELGSLVRSTVLIEPVVFQMLKEPGHERDWQTVERLARNVQEHVVAGRPRRAAAAYMGFWIGPLRWSFTPGKIKRSICETVDKVAAEFGLIESTDIGAADISSLTAPTRLIHGDRTTAPALSVIGILRDALPDCDVRAIKGAGHMSPFTHAETVGTLVTQHISMN